MSLALIAGVPRSGTCWTWELLDAHPGTVSLMPKVVYPDNPKAWNTMETALFADDSVTWEGTEAKNSDEWVRKILDANMVPGKVLIEKTPRHVAFLDRAWSFEPDARVILLDREDKAVRHSFLKRWNTHPALTQRTINTFREHMEKHRGDERVMWVQYEDMTENLEHQLQRMCDHLGLSREGVPVMMSEPRDTWMSEWRKAVAA